MSASHSNSRCPGSVDALSYPGCYEVRKLPGLCKHKVDRTFTLEKRRPIQRCSKKYLPSGTKYYPMAIFVCLIQFDYCHLNSAPLHEFQPPPPRLVPGDAQAHSPAPLHYASVCPGCRHYQFLASWKSKTVFRTSECPGQY